MPILNQLNCGKNSTGNIGTGKCGVNPSVFTTAILIPSGSSYDRTQIAAMSSTLVAQSIDDNRRNRIFKLPQFVGFEDQTADVQRHTYGDGTQKVIRENPLRFRYELLSNLCIQKSLRTSFHQKQDDYDVLFVDSNHIIYGWSKDGATLSGYSLSEIFVMVYKQATYDAPAMYHLEMQFEDLSMFNEYVAYVQLEANPKTIIEAVNDVVLSVGTPLHTNTVDVIARSKCGGLNYADEFPSAAVNPAGWSVLDPTGSPLAGTTIATSVTTNGETALSFTNAGFVAGCTISLASVSGLAALGVEYYESNTITI